MGTARQELIRNEAETIRLIAGMMERANGEGSADAVDACTRGIDMCLSRINWVMDIEERYGLALGNSEGVE